MRISALSKILAGAGAAALASAIVVFGAMVPLSAGDKPVARPGDPAVMTVQPAPPDEAPGIAAPAAKAILPESFVSIEVTGYTPPQTGRVEAVVKLDDPSKGATKEIGRFSFVPNEPFKAEDPQDAQRFIFRVDEKDLERGGGTPPKVTVDLVPAEGQSGEGAELELSRATVIGPAAAALSAPPKPVATPNDPAVVTAQPPVKGDALSMQAGSAPPPAGTTYLVLDVTGYTPPQTGQVEAVVKLDDPATGAMKEVGRFSFYPNEPFKAENPQTARRYMFKLDGTDLTRGSEAQPRVVVELVPAEGQGGEGAQLHVGRATIMAMVPPLPKDKLVATPDSPASVTPKSAEDGQEPQAGTPPPEGTTYLALDVTGYTPPQTGRVEAVVKLDDPATGAMREVGRFSFYPNEPFKAESPQAAQRYLFKLDGINLTRGSEAQPRVAVELVPVEGQGGEGAQLHVGRATIETR